MVCPPTVQTNAATSITTTGATLNGNVISDGGAAVTARGFMYGTSANNLLQTVQSGSGTGSFTASLTGLTSSTTYYYKAYATNSEGTAYGEVLSFTTISYSEPTGYVNGYGYVDLGLSSGTKWAICNVGANSPSEYGNYYAWGETTTKTTYSWSTYRYCKGSSSTMTKYCDNSEYGNNGFTDDQTTLLTSDDAAKANWGIGWRTPTTSEMNELFNNCTFIWTTLNGVNGCLLTGPNGNSIFLPAAGYRDGSEINNTGLYGYYWENSLVPNYSFAAWRILIRSSGSNFSLLNRSFGLSVRPVCAQ
jgi:hypothetical protein